MSHRANVRRRLLAAIRAFQARVGTSPSTRQLAAELGYSQSGVRYALDVAERAGDLVIDRSSYRLQYRIIERSRAA